MNKIDKYILMVWLIVWFSVLFYFAEKELALILFWIIITEVKQLLGQEDIKTETLNKWEVEFEDLN